MLASGIRSVGGHFQTAASTWQTKIHAFIRKVIKNPNDIVTSFEIKDLLPEPTSPSARDIYVYLAFGLMLTKAAQPYCLAGEGQLLPWEREQSVSLKELKNMMAVVFQATSEWNFPPKEVQDLDINCLINFDTGSGTTSLSWLLTCLQEVAWHKNDPTREEIPNCLKVVPRLPPLDSQKCQDATWFIQAVVNELNEKLTNPPSGYAPVPIYRTIDPDPLPYPSHHLSSYNSGDQQQLQPLHDLTHLSAGIDQTSDFYQPWPYIAPSSEPYQSIQTPRLTGNSPGQQQDWPHENWPSPLNESGGSALVWTEIGDSAPFIPYHQVEEPPSSLPSTYPETQAPLVGDTSSACAPNQSSSISGSCSDSELWAFLWGRMVEANAKLTLNQIEAIKYLLNYPNEVVEIEELQQHLRGANPASIYTSASNGCHTIRQATGIKLYISKVTWIDAQEKQVLHIYWDPEDLPDHIRSVGSSSLCSGSELLEFILKLIAKKNVRPDKTQILCLQRLFNPPIKFIPSEELLEGLPLTTHSLYQNLANLCQRIRITAGIRLQISTKTWENGKVHFILYCDVRALTEKIRGERSQLQTSCSNSMQLAAFTEPATSGGQIYQWKNVSATQANVQHYLEWPSMSGTAPSNDSYSPQTIGDVPSGSSQCSAAASFSSAEFQTTNSTAPDVFGVPDTSQSNSFQAHINVRALSPGDAFIAEASSSSGGSVGWHWDVDLRVLRAPNGKEVKLSYDQLQLITYLLLRPNELISADTILKKTSFKSWRTLIQSVHFICDKIEKKTGFKLDIDIRKKKIQFVNKESLAY